MPGKPAFYLSREREREFAEREAAGENLWSSNAPEHVRTKIVYAARNASDPEVDPRHLFRAARDAVVEDLGWRYLKVQEDTSGDEDFVQALMIAPSDEGLFPTLVEALHWAILTDPLTVNAVTFEAEVNDAFRRDRVAWELMDGEMIPFESKEMHAEVVEPALRLLSRRGWEDVETAYRKAIRELSAGSPDDAITDAGSALQEALQRLGCEGNRLDRLEKSAVAKGVLAGYDQKLVAWVAADRGQLGDTHKAESGATHEDAWLAVHVVGALILRLAAEQPRT